MDLPGVENPSKVWAPTAWELRKFYFSKCKGEMGRNLHNRPPPVIIHPPTGENPILPQLLRLSRKCSGRASRRSAPEFLEEDALQLCNLLKREGFLDPEGEANGCAVCATEKLELQVVTQMKRDMAVTRMARNYFLQVENAKCFKLCLKHKPFDPNDSIPRCSNSGCGLHVPVSVSVPGSGPIRPMPVLGSQALFPRPDSFVPIPNGHDPDLYMSRYFEWVNYFNNCNVCIECCRMPYTRNFRYEPDVFPEKEERKIVGKGPLNF